MVCQLNNLSVCVKCVQQHDARPHSPTVTDAKSFGLEDLKGTQNSHALIVELDVQSGGTGSSSSKHFQYGEGNLIKNTQL